MVKRDARAAFNAPAGPAARARAQGGWRTSASIPWGTDMREAVGGLWERVARG
jgi:hypothetical protein